MAGQAGDDDSPIDDLRDRARQLVRLLDVYSERLRRMRERNRRVEAEIAAFEQELERLRQWLEGRAD